ncbi:MAG: PH domain-containing protein, partial [Acidimicrobiales bacterium]
AVATLVAVAALRTSWWGPFDWAILFLFLGALGFFGFTYLQWTTTNFVVTNERLVSRKGVISKEGIEIPLDRINTVFFNQSIFERIIGAGDLGIESAGEGGRQEFTDIRRPNLVQNEIYRQVEGLEDRRLRRLGQAAAEAAPATHAEPHLSIPEQIEKLDQLRRQGVVTDEEFEAKKRELLDRM